MKYDTHIEYYMIEFVLAEKSFYCLWCDVDGKNTFLIDENGILKLFNTEKEIKEFCNSNCLNIQNAVPVLYDIDELTDKISLADIECDDVLDFWNIASDMAAAFKEQFLGDDDGINYKISEVYNKLFYGTNPPALHDDLSAQYIPKWTKTELKIICDVIKDGVGIVRKHVE